MPIDTSIYNNLQPIKIESPLNALMQVSQARALQNQNRMADMAFADKERELSADNALARLLSAGKSGADVATGLASQGYGAKALAYTKQQQDLLKQQADIGKTGAETKKLTAETDEKGFKLRTEKMNQAITDIAGFDSIEQARASLDAHRAAGDLDEMKYQSILRTMPSDPRQFRNWQLGMIKGIMSAKDRMSYETPDQNAILQANTSRANNAATNAVTMRGQNITDTRAREQIAIGKVPAGYRQTADGNLQAIPGGPADLKLQGAFNQDTAALNGSVTGFDRLATAANEVLQHPGLAGITGIRGKIPNIPGSDAANAQALLNTLKSQVGFGVLQDMRNNSKTGGALGAVSDAEGKRLEANLAALENAQSLDQFKSSLKKIIDYSQQAKERTYAAYNMKYAGKGGASAKPSSNSAPSAPKAGDVDGGYRFKGGNPADPNAWEKL